MKQCFRPKSFYEKNSRLITECNAICQTFYDDGYALTLRQLFYQLVSRNRIKNTEREYKNLGVLISDARYAGLIDWDHIVDRIRVLNNDYGSHFTDPEDIINYFTERFRLDVWKDQDVRPEVWVEKDALIQVVANICEPLGVPYIAVKAYSSTSAQWAGRLRFREYIRDGAKPVILHLGDHDATGVDCSRHLKEEMELLVGSSIELRRLALTPEQIEKYELPPQPGKTSDPRFKSYQKEHGTSYTWELDALNPKVLGRIIEDGIREFMDQGTYDSNLARQVRCRQQLQLVSERWDEVQEFLIDG